MKTSLVSRLLGRGSLARALQPRAPLYHPDFPVVVLWSEKAACTTAVKWFFHHIGKLEEARVMHRWVHVYENEVFKAAPGYLEACAAAIRAGKPVIKIVRDPYQRLFSGFLEIFHPRVLDGGDHWSVRVRVAVAAHLHGHGARLSDPVSFNQFCSWLGTQKTRALDGHLAPQAMRRDARLEIEPVRLEDHDNSFGDLEQRLGLPGSLGEASVHVSGHHHAKQAVGEADAPAALDLPVPLDRAHIFKAFGVSSAAIAASPGGAVLRRVFAPDFKAYRYPALA